MGIFLVFISQALQTNLSADLVERAQCQTKDTDTTSSLPCSASFYSKNSTTLHSITPHDFSHAVLFYLFLMAGIFIFFVITFHPKYHRMNAEKKAKFEESVYIQ